MLNHNINTNIVPFVGEEQSISYINRLYIVIMLSMKAWNKLE